MDRRTPPPLTTTLLVCREVFEDKSSGEHALIGPRSDFVLPQFPFVVPAHVFAQLTSGHDSYQPALELLDSEGSCVWREHWEQPFEARDPLTTYSLIFRVGMVFPRPGRYDLVFRLSGLEVGRRVLRARFPPRQDVAELPPPQ
jgi:hypothetical protein